MMVCYTTLDIHGYPFSLQTAKVGSMPTALPMYHEVILTFQSLKVLECFSATTLTFINTSSSFPSEYLNRDGIHERSMALLCNFVYDLLRCYILSFNAANLNKHLYRYIPFLQFNVIT